MKNYYYLDEGLLRAHSPDWEIRRDGEASDGIGDLIGRSAKAALAYNDPTMLKSCINLLKKGMRWPDSMSPKNMARNRLDHQWSKWMHKLGKQKYVKCRPQGSITRDPYVGVICACQLMPGFWQSIRTLKIPWYLNRPDLYFWKRYLEKGKYKRQYEWWALLGLNKKTPVFVLYHIAWMAYVADSEKIKDKLFKYLPHWNILLRVLCVGLAIPWEHTEDYRAKSNYQWQRPKWDTPPEDSIYYLDKDDAYKLDKDILDYVVKML